MEIQMEKINHSLELAVSYNDDNIVKCFIDSNGDVNARTSQLGRTLLQIAVRNDNKKIARMLLERGAEVDLISNDNLTALHIAVSNHSIEMVELLLEFGANVNPTRKFNGKTPLYMAVEHNCPEIVEVLLKKGASVTESTILNTTLLHVALRIGAPELILLILKYASCEQLDLKDNLEGKTPLHMAIECREYEVAEMLLKKGANAEEPYTSKNESGYPLSISVRRRDEKMVALLLKYGAKKSADNCLHYAMRYRCKNIATLLIESGAANLDSTGKNGLTALHMAVINGEPDIVKLCLKHGANVAKAHKVPVLYYAVKNGDPDLVELLIDNGAPINAFVKKNITILDVAVKSRSVSITTLLLKRGAIINLTSRIEEQNFALKHLALLAVADYETSKENFKLIKLYKSWSEFYEKCQSEIEQLKQEKIVGNISFYNLLSKNEDALAAYARNEEFLKAFPNSDYKKKFPTYADTLAFNFTKGKVRKILLEKAISNFYKISGRHTTCHSAQNILKFVSNEDLKNFIRSMCKCNLNLGQHHTCLSQLFSSF